MAAITIPDLTEGTLTGTGVFDQLMRANKAHLDEQYSKSRIKGSEYATVYLGAVQAVMEHSLQFLLQKQRVDLEAQLLGEQIVTEGLNQERIREETQNLIKQRAQIEAETALTNHRSDNAILEGKVLEAQKCKLDAEYDLIQEQKLKVIAETALLTQKKNTERAQTEHMADPESVVGKQIALYDAQRDGYRRDAEQKAAKLLADTWNVRKTMDATGVDADDQNKLGDAYIGQAVTKLLEGINVPV